MPRETTIKVSRMRRRSAIKMVWAHEVRADDVRPAFEQVVDLLNAASEPLAVLVDITSEPNFPLVETMTQALIGPYQHANLTEWLIVGITTQAHIIEEFLTKVTARENVRWFETESAALHHLDEMTRSEAG